MSAFTSSRVYALFKELSAIPRKSNNEKGVRQWLQSFATINGLQYREDAIGNCVIEKSAQHSTSKKRLLLQAHMDMVCEKTPSSAHNFDTDEIELIIDENTLSANGTTLGADNGIGLCMILSLLENNIVSHPHIQALFTMNEETGMVGILGLDTDLVSSPDYCINLDSEEEGIVYISSAGSIDFEYHHVFKEEYQVAPHVYTLSITGLKGGHSGVDINKGRTNAIKVLISCLRHMDVELIDISIGSARNVIPRDGYITFACHHPIDIIRPLIHKVQQQLIHNEGGAVLYLQEIFDEYEESLSYSQSRRVLQCLQSITSGVIEMSNTVDGLVQTSHNLAVATLKKGKFGIITMLRSSNDSSLNESAYMVLSQIFSPLHVTPLPELEFNPQTQVCQISKTSSLYVGATTPGWFAKPQNKLLDIFHEVYQQTYNTKAKELAVHAGLECGVLSRYYPDMDIISFGPDIYDAHSPQERVDIHSVIKTFELFIAVIASL